MPEKLAQVQDCNLRRRHGLDTISPRCFFAFSRAELFERTIRWAYRHDRHFETKASKMPYLGQQIAVIDRRELTDQVKNFAGYFRRVSHGPPAPPRPQRQDRKST